VVSGDPSHLAKKTTIFFSCFFVGKTHVSGKTSISFWIKVLTFNWVVDNIHTSEANETTDATQTRTVTMNATSASKIEVTSKIVSRDPYKYGATASVTINGQTIEASYIGTADESRKEVKAGAIVELRAKASRLGTRIS
jgi:hypothetical protein